MGEFSTSLPAQGAARCVVGAAKELNLINSPVAVSPVLAEAEKKLIVQMLSFLDAKRKKGESLEPDEISSLFTFVFAKAGEAVTDLCNHKEIKFELTGMLDGKIPLYAADQIRGKFKESQFPFTCATRYLQWVAADAEALREADPLLLLFEALKWCFRISCHIAIEILEGSAQA